MIRHINLEGGGKVWYQYDSGTQRTRKRIERNGTGIEERIYLGGFERYRRWVGNALVEEMESLHFVEGEQRVLLVDDVLLAKPTTQPGPNGLRVREQTLFRYQYGNHLGSVGLELDDMARIISYEEFHPYGTSAYRLMNSAVEAPAKRYRYTGMERDEESGLQYNSTRYYATWLGSFGSADAAWLIESMNIYCFALNNPSKHTDKTGKATFLDPDKFSARLLTADDTSSSGTIELAMTADGDRSGVAFEGEGSVEVLPLTASPVGGSWGGKLKSANLMHTLKKEHKLFAANSSRGIQRSLKYMRRNEGL